jgi:hypothetical protein
MSITNPNPDFIFLKTDDSINSNPSSSCTTQPSNPDLHSYNFQLSIIQSVSFKTNTERFNFLGYFVKNSTIDKIAKKIEQYIQHLPYAFNTEENSLLHIRYLAEEKALEASSLSKTTSNGNTLHRLLSNSLMPLATQELLFPLLVCIGKEYETSDRLQQLVTSASRCWDDSIKEADTIFSHYNKPSQSELSNLFLDIGLCEGICTEYLSNRLSNPASHYTMQSPYELKKHTPLNYSALLQSFKVDASQKKKARFISAASMIAKKLKIDEEVSEEAIPGNILKRNKLQIVDNHPKIKTGEEYEYPLLYIAPLIYQIKDSLEESGNLLKLYVMNPKTDDLHCIVIQPYTTFHFLEPSIGFVATKNLNKLLTLLLAHLRQTYPSYTLCFLEEYASA